MLSPLLNSDTLDPTSSTFPAASKPVPLGSFIPWDYKKNSEIIKKELGWKVDDLEGVPAEINQHGEKIECFMQGVRDYIKYLKKLFKNFSF